MNTFQAYCEPCDWTGHERAGNLTALADYDRHVGTYAHRHRELVAAAALAVEAFDADELETYAAAHHERIAQ